jgi:hypothetical protein
MTERKSILDPAAVNEHLFIQETKHSCSIENYDLFINDIHITVQLRLFLLIHTVSSCIDAARALRTNDGCEIEG